MGTANDLARTFGIPPQLDAAADIIISGRIKIIDVGTVNGLPGPTTPVGAFGEPAISGHWLAARRFLRTASIFLKQAGNSRPPIPATSDGSDRCNDGDGTEHAAGPDRAACLDRG